MMMMMMMYRTTSYKNGFWTKRLTCGVWNWPRPLRPPVILICTGLQHYFILHRHSKWVFEFDTLVPTSEVTLLISIGKIVSILIFRCCYPNTIQHPCTRPTSHGRNLHNPPNQCELSKCVSKRSLADDAESSMGVCSLGAALMGLLAHLTRDPDS